MRTAINAYLANYDFDIRKSHDARYVDQKCTPDVVCFLADCILNTAATHPTFTANDIWQSQYFKHNCRVVFNKPYADDQRARNEYNKWFSQPLKLFATAGLLSADTSKRPATYSVSNDDLLDYVSRRERNAYSFLFCFFAKVLKDSGFWRHFEDYLHDVADNHAAARATLYDRYCRLISGNTPSQSRLDITRMFHKVLNVLAADHNVPGSSGNQPRMFSDLMYNRKNWRDLNKEKTITRQEASSAADSEQQEAYNAYYVQKAIALIRKIQKESEVHDVWAVGPATQVHHIFPKSQFPQIAHYVENLILLTATQHNTLAHPGNNTQVVDRDYQLVCLLAKADTIEQSLKKVGERFYRKESYVHVVNTGLDCELSLQLSFSEIKQQLIQLYNRA